MGLPHAVCSAVVFLVAFTKSPLTKEALTVPFPLPVHLPPHDPRAYLVYFLVIRRLRYPDDRTSRHGRRSSTAVMTFRMQPGEVFQHKGGRAE